MDRFLGLSLPGADELMAWLEIAGLARETACDEVFDEVIVDAAPTAHTLRLLAMPEALRRFAGVLDRLQERHRWMAERFGRLPAGGGRSPDRQSRRPGKGDRGAAARPGTLPRLLGDAPRDPFAGGDPRRPGGPRRRRHPRARGDRQPGPAAGRGRLPALPRAAPGRGGGDRGDPRKLSRGGRSGFCPRRRASRGGRWLCGGWGGGWWAAPPPPGILSASTKERPRLHTPSPPLPGEEERTCAGPLMAR